MLRFNTDSRPELNSAEAFQYILCCGSTRAERLACFGWGKISIHLMLRFNQVSSLLTYWKERFQYILCCGSTWAGWGCKGKRVEFQYILCCGSTFYKFFSEIGFRRISIHLMLRFNKFGIIMLLLFRGISIHLMLRFNEVAWRECVAINTISIHLMLRFNQLSKPPPKYKKQISIHLMLRFNGLVNFILDKYIEFQYILCCGSTVIFLILISKKSYFNTSYVAVQLL